MSIKSALLRFARMIVEQVMQRVTQQINRIENEVNQTIQGFVQRIVGGVWRGPDADAFVDEVSHRVVREIGDITQSVLSINNSITTAVDVLDQADQKAQSMAESLGETLAQIY